MNEGNNNAQNFDPEKLNDVMIDLSNVNALITTLQEQISYANSLSDISAGTEINDVCSSVNNASVKIADVIAANEERDKKALLAIMGITEEEYNEYSTLDFGSEEEAVAWFFGDGEIYSENNDSLKGFYVYLINKGHEERKWLNEEFARWNLYNKGKGKAKDKNYLYGGMYSEESLLMLEASIIKKYYGDKLTIKVDNKFLRNSPTVTSFVDKKYEGDTNLLFSDELTDEEKKTKKVYRKGGSQYSDQSISLYDLENEILYDLSKSEITKIDYYGIECTLEYDDNFKDRINKLDNSNSKKNNLTFDKNDIRMGGNFAQIGKEILVENNDDSE